MKNDSTKFQLLKLSINPFLPSRHNFFCDIAHRVISLALTNIGEKGQRAHPLCDEDRVGLFSSAHRIEAKRKSFSHVESRWGARLRMAAFT